MSRPNYPQAPQPVDEIVADARCRGGVVSLYEDIDRTIAMWERAGVDFSDVWWALGRRTPCRGGWPQVRRAMYLWARDHATPARLAA